MRPKLFFLFSHFSSLYSFVEWTQKTISFSFGYRAGTKYTVSVFGMFEGGESVPLAGEENTTYSDDPDGPYITEPSKVA